MIHLLVAFVFSKLRKGAYLIAESQKIVDDWKFSEGDMLANVLFDVQPTRSSARLEPRLVTAIVLIGPIAGRREGADLCTACLHVLRSVP